MKLTEGKLEFTVPLNLMGIRIDKGIAIILPKYSRGQIQKWLKNGSITIDDQPVLPKLKIWGGEKISIIVQDNVNKDKFQAEEMPLDIVYEDDEIMVVNKPPGLVMHPGNGNWTGTLLNGLLHYNNNLATLPRAGIVHRLDKETSGLLVVAKTPTARSSLIDQLQTRMMTREYTAVAVGIIKKNGRIKEPIGRHPIHRTKMCVSKKGKDAITHYNPIESGLDWTLLNCKLETGRTHQIRVHLTHMGHPLIGDNLYKSGGIRYNFHRQALHASRLICNHPALKIKMCWETSIPTDMKELLTRLRDYRS